MTMQPFKIQSPTLSLNGVNIDTSAQGKLVIPGVTRAGTSVAIEVNDTGDQTYAWTSDIGKPEDLTILDGYTYEVTITQSIQAQVGWTAATYAADNIDEEGYIDGISVVDGGAGYTGEAVTYSQTMWATNGISGWQEIPFSVRCGAGEIQSEFGGSGGGSSISNNDETLSIASNGEVVLNGPEGAINRGVRWKYGSDNGGVDSFIRQDNAGFTIQSYADVPNPSGTDIILRTGDGLNWKFHPDGTITFPDNSVQTTAYTGQSGGGSGSTIGFVAIQGDYTSYDTSFDAVTLDTSGNSYYGGMSSLSTTGPVGNPLIVKMDENGAVVWTTYLTDITFDGTTNQVWGSVTNLKFVPQPAGVDSVWAQIEVIGPFPSVQFDVILAANTGEILVIFGTSASSRSLNCFDSDYVSTPSLGATNASVGNIEGGTVVVDNLQSLMLNTGVDVFEILKTSVTNLNLDTYSDSYIADVLGNTHWITNLVDATDPNYWSVSTNDGVDWTLTVGDSNLHPLQLHTPTYTDAFIYVSSENGGDPITWQKSFGSDTATYEGYNSVVIDATNQFVYAVGYSQIPGLPIQSVISKFEMLTGNSLWHKDVNFDETRLELTGVALFSNGDIVTVGRDPGNPYANDGRVTKMDPTGHVLWQMKTGYDNTGDPMSVYQACVVVDASDNVLTMWQMSSQGSQGNDYYLTYMSGTDGSIIWQRSVGTSQWDSVQQFNGINSLAVDDTNFYIGARYEFGMGSDGAVSIKLPLDGGGLGVIGTGDNTWLYLTTSWTWTSVNVTSDAGDNTIFLPTDLTSTLNEYTIPGTPVVTTDAFPILESIVYGSSSQLVNGNYALTLDANGLVHFPGDMLVGTLWPDDPYDPFGPGGDKESVVWAKGDTEYLGLWYGGDQIYPASNYGPVAGIQIGSDVDNVDDFTDAATPPGTGVMIGVNNIIDGTTLKWKFDNTGVLTLPVGGSIVDSNGSPIAGGAGIVYRDVNWPIGLEGDTAGTIAIDSLGRGYICISNYDSTLAEFTVQTSEAFDLAQTLDRDTCTIALGEYPELDALFADRNTAIVTGWTVSGSSLAGFPHQAIFISRWPNNNYYIQWKHYPGDPTIIPQGTEFTLNYIGANRHIWVSIVDAPALRFVNGGGITNESDAAEPYRYNMVLNAENNVVITTDEGSTEFTFDGNGRLTFPGGARIFSDGGDSLGIETHNGLSMFDTYANWETAVVGDLTRTQIIADANEFNASIIRFVEKSNDPYNPTIIDFTFRPDGSLTLPAGGAVNDSNGNDITINGLAPQLVKANSQIEIRGNLKMIAQHPTVAISFDAQTNADVWFNASTGDSQGRTWATGRDSNGNSFLNSYETDGTLRFSLLFNNIDMGGWSGYSTPEPYAIKDWRNNIGNEYIYVGYTISSHIGVTSFDTDGNINNTWMYVVDDPANANIDIRSLAIDGDGFPMVIGQRYGQWSVFNGLAPVNVQDSTHAVSGTAFGKLSVLTTDVGNPFNIYTGDTSYWGVDVNGSGNWQQPSSLNTFNSIPVETVTGTGGRKDVYSGADYATGGIQIDFSTASPQVVINTAQWGIGAEAQAKLTALLAQNAWTLFFETEATLDSNYYFQMYGGWVETDPGVSGVWTAQGNLIVITGPSISGIVNINNLYYNGTITANVGYNIEANGSSYYSFITLSGAGDGYANNDIVAVPGSKLGGRDGGLTIIATPSSVTAGTGPSDKTFLFDAATYPNMGPDNQVAAGFFVKDGPSSSIGLVNSFELSSGFWRVNITFNGTVDLVNLGQMEFYAGNDCRGVIQNNGNSIYNPVGIPVQGVMHFNVNWPVDFRGTENTETWAAGISANFTLGDYKIVSDGFSSWLALSNRAQDPANLRGHLIANAGKVINVNFVDTGGPATSNGISIAGDWMIIPGYPTYRGWLLASNLPLGAGEFDVNWIEFGNDTYTGTSWNVRQTQDTNAFMATTSACYTYGAVDGQRFDEGCFDANYNVVYATGYFNVPNSNAKSVLFAIEYTTGNILWQKNFDDGTGASNVRSVAVDPNGNNVYLTYRNDNYSLVVLKISRGGVLVWAKRQTDGNNWNRIPDVVVDSNGDPILVGCNRMYEPISDTNKRELNIIKLSQVDGSVVYSNGLSRTLARRDIRSYHDRDNNPVNIVDDVIYFGGHTDDVVYQDFYIGLALSVTADGLGLGSYGDWLYRQTSDTSEGGYISIAFEDYTSSVTLNSQSYPKTIDSSVSISYLGYSFTVNNSWSAWLSSATVIGGDSRVAFADSSNLSQAGIARYMKDTTGGSEVTLSAAMNGKFLFYDNNPGASNSTIHIPYNGDVALPIGYTVTVAMADFNGCRVYVDNNNNGNVWILASGQDVWDQWYWMFGNGGLPGIYTIMKVDTNTWILSGPDVQANN